ncbi:MAG: tRNA (adenosine(37)-N6)-threonylcarbamoyltransferase complex ATPase subunit type 1 TsaE [Patescibacteria group bacterium]
MKITESAEQTHQVAQELAKKLLNGGIICLYGDLGSGKTTFVKGMAEILNIPVNQIKSPTYTYVRHHEINGKNIYHIDLYRLEEIDDLLLRELKELWENQENIIIIEWADRLKDHLPRIRTDVFIENLGENSRKITINNE